MSNLYFNIRIGRMFFQLTNDWRFEIKPAYEGCHYRWPVAVYCAFGYHF